MKMGVVFIEERRFVFGLYCVYFNGVFIGIVEDGRKFVERIRVDRRVGKISDVINVVFYEDEEVKEVYINSDDGRVRRFFIVVENGKLKFMREYVEGIKNGIFIWSDFIRMGVIEYFDVEEEENVYVVIWFWEVIEEYIYFEFMFVVIFGIFVLFVLYLEYNVVLCNIYGVGMVK